MLRPMATQYTVRPTRADEWREIRGLRLQALSDEVAPMAFLETHEAAVARPDEFWQDRARSSSVDAGGAAWARQFVAVADDGRWVGMVVALVERTGDENLAGAVVDRPVGHLVAVYLAPGHRGRGVLTDLFAAATGWLRERGLDRARLFVHTENVRAQRAYEKAGFRATGVRITTVAGTELEMAATL